MSNKTYDTLKNIALILAPCLVFVAAVLKIWNVPYTTEITATLSALDVLIGSIVKVSNLKYSGEEGGDGE